MECRIDLEILYAPFGLIFFLFIHFSEQECIPVRCVPSAVVAVSAGGGGVCPGERVCTWGRCAQGVCVCLWGGGGVCHVADGKNVAYQECIPVGCLSPLANLCVLVPSVVGGVPTPWQVPSIFISSPSGILTPPPPEKPLADTCEYITCPQLLLWVVIISWHPLWFGATNSGSATKT